VDDLVDFLKARLDEAEQDSQALLAREGQSLVVLRLARERLAEVDAKRRIVDEHQRAQNGMTWTAPIDQPGSERVPVWICERCSDRYPEAARDEEGHVSHEWPCLTVRLLALPYAEHPDYRTEWQV
jgi:hypothetical protein